MTDKRFTWNSKDVMIDDTVTGNQLEVIDITEIDVLLEVLNELHEENKNLKDFDQHNYSETKKIINNLQKENEQLKQLLDYADDLIQSHLSEHFIRQWRNFKTGHKEYNDFWEEKLKTHKKLKEDVE